jgi:hypothetical protein
VVANRQQVQLPNCQLYSLGIIVVVVVVVLNMHAQQMSAMRLLYNVGAVSRTIPGAYQEDKKTLSPTTTERIYFTI